MSTTVRRSQPPPCKPSTGHIFNLNTNTNIFFLQIQNTKIQNIPIGGWWCCTTGTASSCSNSPLATPSKSCRTISNKRCCLVVIITILINIIFSTKCMTRAPFLTPRTTGLGGMFISGRDSSSELPTSSTQEPQWWWLGRIPLFLSLRVRDESPPGGSRSETCSSTAASTSLTFCSNLLGSSPTSTCHLPSIIRACKGTWRWQWWLSSSLWW